MVLASTPKTKGININMPFDLWYQLNKANLPFYAPPTKSTSTDSEDLVNDLIPSDSLEDLIENYGEETKDVLSTWTEEDFATAYAEAR